MKTLKADDKNIHIRAFERGDIVELSRFAAALPPHDLLFLRRDIQHARVIEAWAQAIDDGEIDTLVALDGASIVGTSAVVRDPLSWSPHVAEIRVLVSPEVRGLGLGRILLDGCITIAAERGATKLVANMTPDQKSAIALFEESGFRGEAMLRDHVRDREGQVFDLAILSLDLRRAGARQASWGLDSAA